MTTNEPLFELLACPRCKGKLTRRETLDCDTCMLKFPVIEGVPVLLNEDSSVFKIADYTTVPRSSVRSGAKDLLKRSIPSITLNIGSDANYRRFTSLMQPGSRVLVVGGATEGSGFGRREDWGEVEIIETDVVWGPQTQVICDGHDLPFPDLSFDGVIIQAVLEHVLDPVRCVSEIERVLTNDGIVYAETPFMQQVHLGRYDFMRFSYLGHRRLFRNFEELASGASCGPGTALAWSYCYFLMSLFKGRTLQQAAFALGSFTSFYLKYFDHIFQKRPGLYDAASSYFFLGKKSDTVLSDHDLIAGYPGMMQ